jgi:hypothetical protein
MSMDRLYTGRSFTQTYSPSVTNTELSEVTVAPTMPRPARPGSKPVEEWEPITTPDGKTYYHNTTTGETSWELPQSTVLFFES